MRTQAPASAEPCEQWLGAVQKRQSKHCAAQASKDCHSSMHAKLMSGLLACTAAASLMLAPPVLAGEVQSFLSSTGRLARLPSKAHMPNGRQYAQHSSSFAQHLVKHRLLRLLSCCVSMSRRPVPTCLQICSLFCMRSLVHMHW